MTPAADRLTARLLGRPPALGVFLPAGFPTPQAGIPLLRAFADQGAGILEIGVPHSDPVLDGPEIAAAHAQALHHGTKIADVLDTVRELAATTPASMVVMSYWNPVHRYGPERFAKDLATAGTAGAMIVDLPVEEAGPWLAAARAAGVHTPQLVSRRADDTRLARVCAASSGWLYAPAAEALTGYDGRLDIPALGQFTRRLRRASSVPVVTGIGVSSPAKAAEVSSLVSGVVIGTPVVRPLLEERNLREGMDDAVARVTAFAAALRNTEPSPESR
ncbi:tryptophan synthase subunit alpha [Streptomyces sp. NPDC001889]